MLPASGLVFKNGTIMHFKDSCVTDVTPFSLLEEATSVSDNIFPAYTGTSKVVLGIDASGLQNFSNARLQRAFGSVDATGDTYVVAHGRMGDHITERNALPYGYLTWKIRFDNGFEVEPEKNKDDLSCWKRELLLDEGRVQTSMLVGYFARASIGVTAAFHTKAVLLSFALSPYDYKILNYVPEKAPESATVEISLQMRTRQGKKLYDEAKLKGDVLCVRVKGYENYEDRIRMSCGAAKPVFENDALKLSFRIGLASPSETKIVLDFSGQNCAADYDELARNNILERKAYFERVASVEGPDVEEEFLYNNSHYLCMSGFDYSMGLPIGMPFMLPKWWRCSTFWDSHFVMDALMRSGARAEADEFVCYLHKSMNKEGKPFPWMFAYDGKPTVEEGRDIAPLVMCAHAMTAIKHYFYFRDGAMLREHILPIVERVADFGARVLFSKGEDGKYTLSVPVSNDVVEETASEVNQTFTAVWFLSVLALCVRLQEIAGKESSPLLQEIVASYRLEKNEEEYLHSRGMTAEECPWASWLPFLLYPTEGMPFVEKELFDKTRRKYTYPRLYMEKQGSYQPWTEFMEASSDFRRGALEEGYALRKLGMEHCFGTGLFSEIGPKQQTCGICPYISAHGTYVSAYLYQFITTDIWTQRVGIFDALPSAYKGKDLHVRGVACAGGISVDAELTAYSLRAKIRSSCTEKLSISMKIPEQLRKDALRLFINGERCAFRLNRDSVETEFNPSGEDKVELI